MPRAQREEHGSGGAGDQMLEQEQVGSYEAGPVSKVSLRRGLMVERSNAQREHAHGHRPKAEAGVMRKGRLTTSEIATAEPHHVRTNARAIDRMKTVCALWTAMPISELLYRLLG